MEAETSSDVEPEDYFCQLGLLVLEGRTPEPSLKGRCDGPHCPVAPGDSSVRSSQHNCDLERSPQCRVADNMRRQMLTLWKNRIPMCIELLLLPPCEHGRQVAYQTQSGAGPPPLPGNSLLLEQWFIQAHPRRGSERNGKSPHLLFQAVRSYLHFSQLSAWLNLTHGAEPVNFGYRISPPGEFCTSQFQDTPELHRFPTCKVSKSINIKVSVSTLPRLPYIPKPSCTEDHLAVRSIAMVQDTLRAECFPGKFRPDDDFWKRRSANEPERYSPETTSPRFNKPRVKSMQELEEESLRLEPEQQRGELCSALVHRRPCAVKHFSPSPPIPLQNPEASLKAPSTGRLSPGDAAAAVCGKDSGAVPKRPLSRKYPQKPQPDFSDEHAQSAPELDSMSSAPQTPSCLGNSCTKNCNESMSSSPKVILTQRTAIPNLFTRDLTVAWATMSRESTDSDTSSPEIDRLLSKTLARQTEPLSPAEMDAYMNIMCPGLTDKKCNSKMAVSPTMNKNLLLQAQKYKQQQSSPESCLHSPKMHGFKSENSLCAMTLSPKLSCIENIQHVYSMGKLNRALMIKHEGLPCSSNGQAALPHLGNKSLSPPSPSRAKCILSALPSDERINDLKSESPPSEVQNGVSPCDLKTDSVSPRQKIKFVLGDDGEDNEGERPEVCVQRPKAIALHKITDNTGAAVAIQDNAISPHSKLNAKTPVGPPSHTGGIPSQASRTPLKKSVSCPYQTLNHSMGNLNRANSLLKSVMKKEFGPKDTENSVNKKHSVPSAEEKACFQRGVNNSAKMLFHSASGLPLQSSPAPIKKKTSNRFDYDDSLTNVRAIKNSLSCVNLENQKISDLDENTEEGKLRRRYSQSAPASTNCLLGNFEESLLNGRIEPSGVVDGFTVDIGASGSFCPKHVTQPVTAFFFSLSDDNAPSPYLGHVNLEGVGKRGYHIPKKGTVQVTLFNPNKAVVKMFVVVYDMSDMPANCQTFLRQRSLYMPVKGGPSDSANSPVYLRYLIHLRFASNKSRKVYLHTDMRLIFARDKLEFDSRVANYELRSFTEGPVNPKFSPKR